MIRYEVEQTTNERHCKVTRFCENEPNVTITFNTLSINAVGYVNQLIKESRMESRFIEYAEMIKNN